MTDSQNPANWRGASGPRPGCADASPDGCPSTSHDGATIGDDDGASEEYRLAPEDSEATVHRRTGELPVPGHLVIPEEGAGGRWVFGLWHLFGLTSFVAVSVALSQWVDPGWVAGVMGFVAMLGLVWMKRLGRVPPLLQMAWGALFLLYVVYAVVAAWWVLSAG